MEDDSIRVEGYRAFQDQATEEQNPYPHGTQAYEDWDEGWQDAWGEWFYKDWTPEWFQNSR